MSKRTLRQKYLNDPAARKFLEENPEFDDRFLDQTAGPQWDVNKGRYTLKEVKEDQDIYGSVMLEALNALPESHHYRPILEAYYLENAPLNELQRRFGTSTMNALWAKLYKARKAAIRAWMRPKNIKNKNPAIAEREFVYEERRATLYLRFCEHSADTIWTLKDGTILPETVQQILDENVDYKEWDLIFIDGAGN